MRQYSHIPLELLRIWKFVNKNNSKIQYHLEHHDNYTNRRKTLGDILVTISSPQTTYLHSERLKISNPPYRNYQGIDIPNETLPCFQK
jgi:hypothetical protein